MINKLDSSHQCVLANWETITRMIDCRAQVATHLKAVRTRVAEIVHAQHQQTFLIDQPEDDTYYQLYPSQLGAWKGSNAPLLVMGIEQITPEGLLHIGTDGPCAAFVFSVYRTNKKINDSTTDGFALIEPVPLDFERSFDIPWRGYLFRKVLPALKPDEITDQAKLEQYLTEPTLLLIDWYKQYEKAILGAMSGGSSSSQD